MRFDNIAQAAMTPGGFNAGVNDIIQAVMRARMAKAAQEAKQEEQQWDRGMQEKTLGQQMSNNLANQGFREREVKANETRAQTDQGLAGNTIANTWADNMGSVGKFIGDKLMPDAKGAGATTPANDLAREKFDYEKNKDFETQARRDANIEVYGNPDGHAQDVQDENLEIFGMPQIDPKTGAAAKTGNKKYVKRLPNADESKRAEGAYRKIMATRTTSLPASGVVSARAKTNTGDTDGLSVKEPAPTQGGLGGQITGAMGAKPPVDYASEDAKLQASDPQYRQLRSNPKFNWRAAIDATLAQGQ